MANKDKNKKLNENAAAEDKIKSDTLNVDDLSFDEAKNILKDLLKSNEEIINELNSVKNEALENKDKWYRSVAEFENYKKRNAETRKNAYFDGKKDVLLGILVIGDSIERALKVDMDDATKEGVNLISRQFNDTLKSFGVTEINPLVEAFDPNTCEAIHSVPCQEGEAPNVVKTVFKKGYKMDDRIIRYCQVVVTVEN